MSSVDTAVCLAVGTAVCSAASMAGATSVGTADAKAVGRAVDTGVNMGVDTIAGTTNAAGTAGITAVSMAASSSEPLLYFARSLKRY